MLTAHQIHKNYNLNIILEDISFSITPGERVGLIGANGCGKTTLLRILAGEDRPDQGSVSRAPGDLRLGYLPQGLQIDPKLNLGQVIEKASGDAQAVEDRLARLAAQLESRPDDSALQEAYDATLGDLQAAHRISPSEVAGVLEALGLHDIDPLQPVGQLSGGQKTRLSLAMVLLSDPQVLLLDEPTNHLDIVMLEWLENWLAGFSGGALIVSHDRTFLNRTVNRIIDLDAASHRIRAYAGNYDDYLEEYLAESGRLMSAYKDQEAEIRRIRGDIRRTKQQSLRVEQTTTSRQPNVRRYAKKVAKKALSREKKLERFLRSEDRVDKPVQGWQMKLKFDSPPGAGETKHLGRDILRTENLSVGYPGYPPLLEGLDLQVHPLQRIAFTGANGSGKTTLLRTLAGNLSPAGGSVHLGASVKMGYMAQEHETLDPALNAVQVLQRRAPLNETEARSFLHYFLFSGDDAVRPVELLSYGERARLLLAALVASGCNLLLLDEPINHLDIPSRTQFEQALSGFEGAILAVVHDRYFIDSFATDLWIVEDRGIRRDVLRV